ncbi:MAG: glycosyltransferase [Salinivirgaceae bacterium]
MMEENKTPSAAKLAICIPVYNHYVYPLANELAKQAAPYRSTIEIIILDDASDPIYTKTNRLSCQPMVRYIVLDRNIGRSRIRNRFLEYTNASYMLFLDGDVNVRTPDFVARYYNLVNYSNIEVAAGGHLYDEEMPEKKYRLRWKYGRLRETKQPSERRKYPYKSFKTSNFIVARSILQTIRFNENIRGYGHEDTLFGFELKIRQYVIVHIDNPVHIEHYDTNILFLKKVKQSVCTLATVTKWLDADRRFVNDVSLLRFMNSICKKKLQIPFYVMSFPLTPIVRLLILSGVHSLRLLDLYKLLCAFRYCQMADFRCTK